MDDSPYGICARCGEKNIFARYGPNMDIHWRCCITHEEIYGVCDKCEKMIGGDYARYGPNKNMHMDCLLTIEEKYDVCIRCGEVKQGEFADYGPNKDMHYNCYQEWRECRIMKVAKKW